MSDLKLYLFGAPRLEGSDGPVAFDTRKAFALLAYLALHDPQHRDVLGGLLWPDQDAGHARGALRRTLSVLKKSLPEDALTTTRDLVELQADALWIDVVEFRSKLPSGDPVETQEALGLYREDLLNGFALKGAPAFDDWVSVERESLRRDAIRSLAGLATTALDNGGFDDALRWLRRWVALEPLDETAHRMLMQAYLAGGDRAAALRQYDECVRVLDEELAVGPLDETTALYESIRSGATSRPPGERRTPDTETEPELPLVGRGEELDGLLRASNDDTTRLIVIEGEAGIGKTALVDRVVAGPDRLRLDIRCHEEERDHAFGAAARLLRSVYEEASTKVVAALEPEPAREAARLVPDIRALHADIPEPAPLTDPGARTAFFEGVWIALRDLLQDAPALIVVDDAHWLDEGSFELLAFCIRREELGDFKTILTWRTEEVGPADPIRRFAEDFARSGSGSLSLRLSRLHLPEVAELVGAAVPNAPTQLAVTLFEESEGVPFFVVEYLRTHISGESPSGGVEGFVRSQVGRLSPVGQQVLAAASVLGRSSDLDLLRAVAGRNDDETVEALEELTSRKMLLERQEGYDFAHEKVRQVVYADVTLARVRLLHARAHDYLLNTLAQRPETRALAAYHALKAGRDQEAAEHYRLAAEHARTLGANAEALGHLQIAIALGYPDLRLLHEEIGDVQTLLGRYGDALTSYRSALARSEETWRLEHKLGRLHLRRGDASLARGHLETALEDVPPSELGGRARIAADLSLALRTEEEEPAARDAALAALRDAEDGGDEAAQAQAHNILGLIEIDPSKALDHLRASEASALAAEETGTRIAALNNIAVLHRRQGNTAEAIRAAEEALELCERRGDVHRQAALHNNLADAFHEAGDDQRSKQHAREAAVLFAQVGEPGVMSPEIWMLEEW